MNLKTLLNIKQGFYDSKSKIVDSLFILFITKAKAVKTTMSSLS